jgi:hypothetical protein
MCAMCPAHLILLDLIILIIFGVQITEPLIVQFCPLSCHLIPLRSKYSPKHPVLKHPHFVFSH